jgi:hypothetical protein
MRLVKGTTEIRTVEGWRLLAPPKGKDGQWKNGRSAKELAGAWCRTGVAVVPNQIRELLESRPEIGAVEFTEGEPERAIAFDQLAGEPRNADMAIRARCSLGVLGITIEAKADEPFGERLGDVVADAIDRRIATRALRACNGRSG